MARAARQIADSRRTLRAFAQSEPVTAMALAGLSLLCVVAGYILGCLSSALLLPLSWLLAGSGLWGCWTVAHDCIHGAFARNRRCNEIIGNIVLIPTLFPFYTTKSLHLAHHRHLNNVWADRAWCLWPTSVYASKPAAVQWLYRCMRSWAWWAGPLLFLVTEHYRLGNAIPKDRAKMRWTIAAIAIYALTLAAAAIHADLVGKALAVGVGAHIVFSGIFATLTLMQHTLSESALDEAKASSVRSSVSWHDSDAPGSEDPIEHTLDYAYPRWFEPLLWNGHIHSPHHLEPRIPFYKLRTARQALLAAGSSDLEAKIRICSFSLTALFDILRHCHLYDEEKKLVISFEKFSQNPVAMMCQPSFAKKANALESGRIVTLTWLFATVMGLSVVPSAEAKTARVPIASCAHFVSSQPLTAADVMSDEYAARFKPINCGSSSFGFDTRQHWMRVTFAQPPVGTTFDEKMFIELGYSALDYVAFYQRLGDEIVTEVTGDMLPFHSRSIKHRAFVFAAHKTSTPVFIEIKTAGSVQMPLRILPGAELAEATAVEFGSMGLYYGIIAGMILYNFFLYLIIRDLTYLYYVLYVTGYAGFQLALNGLGFMYLWPDAPIWNNVSIPTLIAAMFAFMFLFTMRFLDTGNRSKWMHRCLGAGFIASTLATIAAPFLPLAISIKSIVLFSIVAAVVVLVAGAHAVLVGYRPARYFLIAWSTFLVGIIIISFKNFGVLPSNFFTDYGMQIGSALETVLLSMGLGYRIRRAEDERAAALIASNKVGQEAAKVKAVAQTMQMLAHDVRRPFAMLKGMLDALRGIGNAPEAQNLVERFLPEVRRSIDAVNGMIQDVMESGRDDVPMQKQPTSLRALLRESLYETFSIYHKASITFHYDLIDLDIVDVDRARIQRVISNILANAVEATGGRGRLWIISRLQSDGLVEISIANDGPPIPAEAQGQLFTAFFSQAKVGGTGLGLAIAKKIVLKHGGQIWCDSTSEKTTFHFTLPTASDAAVGVSIPESSLNFPANSWTITRDDALAIGDGGQNAMPVSGATTLIVIDDCEWTLEAWRRIGQSAAHTFVTTFTSAIEFKQYLTAKPIDLTTCTLVIDYYLSNDMLNGADLARWLKACVPIGQIFLSTASDEVADEVRQLFDGVLPKDPVAALAVLANNSSSGICNPWMGQQGVSELSV